MFFIILQVNKIQIVFVFKGRPYDLRFENGGQKRDFSNFSPTSDVGGYSLKIVFSNSLWTKYSWFWTLHTETYISVTSIIFRTVAIQRARVVFITLYSFIVQYLFFDVAYLVNKNVNGRIEQGISGKRQRQSVACGGSRVRHSRSCIESGPE